MRKKCVKAFSGIMAAAILMMQAASLPGNILQASAAGTKNGAVTKTADEWSEVLRESEETNSVYDLDEFGCRLKPWHACYKYEYAYRTGDTSGLTGEKEIAFYEGLKGYLDYAYQFDTPYEQEKAIHDYMVLNCKYAVGHYIDGKLSNDVWNYDGVFVYGQAVCQGYSLAFKLCMDILGIESQIILGQTPGGKHAWNVVKLDGEWYYIDVTWDDPVPDVEGKVVYNYFNVPLWWIEQEHEIKAPADPIGTKYSADEVLTLTVGSEKKEMNRMLASHFWDLSSTSLYRVYLVKEDGVPWTKEEVTSYRVPLNLWNKLSYKQMGWWDTADGTTYCLYFQGRATPGKVIFVACELVLIFLSPVLVISVIVWLVKRHRKKKRELNASSHMIE